MSAKIVPMNWPTRLDLPVAKVLDAAKAAELQSVVVIGYDAEGVEYFASSMASGPEALWLLARAQKRLLDV